MNKFWVMMLFLTFAPGSFALRDREGDLQMPVTDVSTIQKQEAEEVPTLDAVKMQQKKVKPKSPKASKVKR